MAAKSKSSSDILLRYAGPSDYFEDEQSGTVWKRGENVEAVSAEVRDRVTGIRGESFEEVKAGDAKDAPDLNAADVRASGVPLVSTDASVVIEAAPGVETGKSDETPEQQEGVTD